VSVTVEEEIAILPTLSKAELQEKWRERLKQPAPPHLNKPNPGSIARLQTAGAGFRRPEAGVQAASSAIGRELRAGFEQNGQNSFARRENQARHSVDPGVGIRVWDGQIHQVTVAEDGFEYKGTRYGSLSEIARLIRLGLQVYIAIQARRRT
jgi:hypothetical protein